MPTKIRASTILAVSLASAACHVASGGSDTASSQETGEGGSGGETGGGAPEIELDWRVELDVGDAVALVCDIAVGEDGTVVVAGVSVTPVDYSPIEGWVMLLDDLGTPGETVVLRDAHSPGALTVGSGGEVFVTGSFGDLDGEHGLWFARLEPDGTEAWYESEPGEAWSEGVFNPCWDADAAIGAGGRYLAVFGSDIGVQTSFRIFEADGTTHATGVLDEQFSWAPARVVVDTGDHFFVAGRAAGDTWGQRHHVVEKYDFEGQRVWSSAGPGSLLGVLASGPGGDGVGLLGEPVDDGALRVGYVDADGQEEWTGAWPHLETHHPMSDWGESIVFMQTLSHEPREERLAGMWVDGSAAWTHPLVDGIEHPTEIRSGADGALYMFGNPMGQPSWLARLTGK